MRGDAKTGRRLLLAVALGVFASAAAVSGNTQGAFCPLKADSIGCQPPLQFALDGAVAPKELPKRAMAPVALRIRGEVSAGEGDHPPALKEITLGIDRNGVVEAKGLPVCSPRRLTASDTPTARRVCSRSLVGTGIVHIGTAQAAPIPATLSLFNGGVTNGVTKLLIHAGVPSGASKPIVTAMKIRKVEQGRYGLEAVMKLPAILDGNGSVLDFAFKIERRFEGGGETRSYLAARCRDGRLQTSVEAVFSKEAAPALSGPTMTGTVIRPCTTQG